MSASLGLYRLQKVDSRISQTEARLAEIQKALEDNLEVRNATEQVRGADSDLSGAQRGLQKLETEAKDQQVKIQQAEASLYGGSIHNPKELQDLQADVASLKKQLATLEERQLEAMLRVDETKTTVQTAQLNLEMSQTKFNEQHQHLIEEQSRILPDLETLRSERQAVVSSIAGDLLKAYETLRQQRRGLAVAEVSENACGACGTTLTAALQQSARYATDLVHCPSCGRILYAT